MFLLDLITPNRRSPGWQFILFSVLFLTFLGLTLEYYVEMKLGYVLGITLGSLVVLATIYGILVRNRGDLLEQIVERELKSNSDEYLVLDHKLSQYSQLLESGGDGNYDVGNVNREMGKVRSRMNELDSDGRLYFGSTATSVARDDLKKTKEGYVNELVKQRQIVLGNIRDSSNRDIVADSREERELSINREVLRKINKELNKTENLYDRVGISMDESRKIADRIEVINGQLARQDQEPEEERELERQRRELQKLESQIKDFSRPRETKVVTMEAGEAYLEAGRRLKDVKGARTGKGKEYEQERQDRRDEEKEIKRIISLSTTTNFDGLKKETAEVLDLYKNERDNKRLLSEFNKGGLKTLEKREGLLTRYGETDLFQAMTDAQKRDFLDGKLEKSKLVDAAEKLGTYAGDLRREKSAFFEKDDAGRQTYMEIKGSQAVLESRFKDLGSEYQTEIDRIKAELGGISGDTTVVEKSINKSISELDDKLGKLDRGDLKDLGSLPEISAILDVEKGVDEWKKLESFKTRAETEIGSISNNPGLDRERKSFLKQLVAGTRTIGAGNLDRARDGLTGAIRFSRQELFQAAAAGGGGAGGAVAAAAAAGTAAPDPAAVAAAPAVAASDGVVVGGAPAAGAAAPAAAGTPDEVSAALKNTVTVLEFLKENGAADVKTRAEESLAGLVVAANNSDILKAKSKISLAAMAALSSRKANEAKAKIENLSAEAKTLKLEGLERVLKQKRADIERVQRDGDPLLLQKELTELRGLVGDQGEATTATMGLQTQITENLGRIGSNVSSIRFRPENIANGIEEEKTQFINQQKSDLRAKLKLEKKILEKAKGIDFRVSGQEIESRGVLPQRGEAYDPRTQNLLRLNPTRFTTPAPSADINSINLTQSELQDIFGGYGIERNITGGDRTIQDLKGLDGGPVYRRLIEDVIARTRGNAQDAISKIQRRKILEAQKTVLETTKKQVEEAPNSLEKQRVDAQKKIIGVREAGPVPVISF
jgi:hypothetical protein